MKIEIPNIELVALFFSTNSCGACAPIGIQIEEAMEKKFAKIAYLKVRLEDNPELRGKYMVFSAPTFILLVDGKEYMRESGVFSVIGLLGKIERIYNQINSD